MSSPTDSTELPPPSSKIAVKFTKTEMLEGIVYYHVLVKEQNSKVTWLIQSRYSHLLQIHKQIRKEYRGPLPEFPPKKCCGNTNPEFISLRLKALEFYLNTILKIINIDLIPTLKSFLIDPKRESKTIGRKDTDGKIGSEEESDSRGFYVYFPKNEKFPKIIESINNRYIDLRAEMNIGNDDDQQRRSQYKRMKIRFDPSKSQLINTPLPTTPHVENYKKHLNKSSLVTRQEEVLFKMDDINKRLESRIRNLSGAITHFNIVHSIVSQQK